jgi:hypothetical protein
LYTSINSPISLSCEILLRYNELDQLVRKVISSESYNDPSRFRDDYQAVSFLKKAPFSGFDSKGAAKAKFAEAEAQCERTNARIRSFITAPEKASSVVRDAFCIAARKISEVLGTFDIREWMYSCRFGPGTFSSPVHSGLSSVYDKLQVTPTVTYDFREQGAMLVTSSPSWARSILDIETEGFWPIVTGEDLVPVPGNRVTFVPKTAVTDRPIAIEPLLNIYAQLGIGAMVRRRLKRVGIDLDDQTPNQEGARLGSIDGYLCTLDLSSASDTVAKEVVRSILPDEWHFAMDLCRSKVGTLDGETFQYQKFSSMGNGYTFELESLIFWALSHAACEITGADSSRVLVYGDDIVVPSDAYTTLVQILEFFGFALNQAKSFNSGVFRESCGKDYYDGIEVRPFFQKEIPSEASSLFKLANGLRLVAWRNSSLMDCDSRLHTSWSRVVRALPALVSRHLKVPASAGTDYGLISSWDEAQSSAFVRPHLDGWDGWLGARLVATPIRGREVTNFNGAVASLLYSGRNGYIPFAHPGFPRQGREFRYTLQEGFFHGPWTQWIGWLNKPL